MKISENMHENLRLASGALSRSINAQAEHWMRIGMLAEPHPDLDPRQIRAEQQGGLDLQRLYLEGSADPLPQAAAGGRR